MTRIGTPLSPTATRVLLCGGGELGKEVVIELQRLGVEVIVVDRYANAPAMQAAHRSHVISMLDGDALRAIIEQERPHYIVPEIEAIAISASRPSMITSSGEPHVQPSIERLTTCSASRCTPASFNTSASRTPCHNALPTRSPPTGFDTHDNVM